MDVKSNYKKLPQCPAQLFIDLWLAASAWSPHQRSTAVLPNSRFIAKAENAMEQPTAQDVFDCLYLLLETDTDPEKDEKIKRGKILEVMKTIDNFFYRIHPRALFVSTSVAPRPSLPDWLREMRDNRSVLGDYGKTDHYRLIPRGPLLRIQRVENASNADSLADRFAALAVVQCKLSHEARIINIRHRIIGTDLARGVAPGSKPGHEVVAFIPIAEHTNDLVATEHQASNQKKFVDFRVKSTVDAADRLIKALLQVGNSDIAMAPELVMSEEHADKLPDRFLSFKNPPSRIIIAGSGPTRTTDEGLPWNESRVFNGFGTELWRQRKIWPAGLSQQRAIQYNLSDPGNEGLILESNAAGDEIVIVDADNLGRCVVLICQDIESLPLSEEIIRQYQPDWVFTPVLDPGIKVGGWVHQRAFNLSAISQTRFLVASSTTLARWLNSMVEPTCGLAVGPKSTSTSEDQGRLYIDVPVIDKSMPGYAIVTWRSKGWKKTSIS